MKSLSFKKYLNIIEDVDQEVLRLQQQISDLESQKYSRIKPLDDAIGRLRTMLASKQQQQQRQVKQQPGQQPGTNTTTTPGSTGAQTPGR